MVGEKSASGGSTPPRTRRVSHSKFVQTCESLTGPKKLPAKAWLKFQIHYTPNGKATEDRTRIAFRFTDKAPTTIPHEDW